MSCARPPTCTAPARRAIPVHGPDPRPTTGASTSPPPARSSTTASSACTGCAPAPAARSAPRPAIRSSPVPAGCRSPTWPRARSWACRPPCRCSATRPLDPDELVMLAHLVMAPGADDQGPKLWTENREVANDIEYRGRPSTCGSPTAPCPVVAARGTSPTASRSGPCAQRHGVAADPEARRVPQAVFRLPREQLARFLNRALGAGGVGVASPTGRPRPAGAGGSAARGWPTICVTCCCASASAPRSSARSWRSTRPPGARTSWS